MIIEQERRRRRLTYRLVQLVLVVLTIGIGIAYWGGRRSDNFDPDVDIQVGRERGRGGDVRLSTDVPTASQLGPGDVQLLNRDRNVDLILYGPHIYAGLSPQAIARVRGEIDKAGPDDSSGVAAFVASTIKEQVADKIGLHARYDVADIRDIRLEGDRLVIEWRSGKEQQLFESVRIDRDRGSANRFINDEALRFIELVKARQEQLRHAGPSTIIVPLPKRP